MLFTIAAYGLLCGALAAICLAAPAKKAPKFKPETIARSRATVARVYSEECSCSAVCVSPTGKLLSVAHCGTPTHAKFAGKVWKVRVIDRTKNAVDGGLLLQIVDAGKSLPYAKIAKTAPARGDPVFSWGFPHGKLTLKQGRVLQAAEFRFSGKEGDWQKFLLSDFDVELGYSGSPLFNARGEVVGLCSISLAAKKPCSDDCVIEVEVKAPLVLEKRAGAWQHTADVQRLAAVKYVRRVSAVPHLRVFGFSGCPGCDAFRRDWAAGKFAGREIEYHEVARRQNGRWVEAPGMKLYRALVAALEKATGKAQPPGFPAFHLAGSDRLIVGYHTTRGVDRLFSHLKETLRLPVTVVEAIEGLFGGRQSGASALPEIGTQPKPDAATPPPNEPNERLIGVVVTPPDKPEEDGHPLWPYVAGAAAWLVKRWHERTS